MKTSFTHQIMKFSLAAAWSGGLFTKLTKLQYCKTAKLNRMNGLGVIRTIISVAVWQVTPPAKLG